jgi:putative ABC transport system permease protein
LFYQPSAIKPRKIFVRTTPGNPAPALEAIDAAWKKLAPGLTMQYSFLDEDFDRFYKSEERWSRIIGSAGAISIFLACLGLLGLASLAAVNRTREIGIRKVLGASIFTITGLLTKDFLKLVAIAFVIAAPLTWFGMSKWLESYAYRTELNGLTFLSAGLAVAMLAFFTIGFHAVKKGVANPVKSLRTE